MEKRCGECTLAGTEGSDNACKFRVCIHAQVEGEIVLQSRLHFLYRASVDLREVSRLGSGTSALGNALRDKVFLCTVTHIHRDSPHCKILGVDRARRSVRYRLSHVALQILGEHLKTRKFGLGIIIRSASSQ
jgi:hypothetical protein